MKVYLVGGAVRDKLLGLPVGEKDWVVVGATPEEMIAAGFQPVGKEFPVFLHPKTHEEYALARTERKVAKGYKGFTFYASPEVTLKEDLARRDLTINAIAETPEGELIDPYHGAQDVKDKLFRHVSAAFQEDPVRILRLARFAARFPDFHLHPETLALMKKMVAAGEVDALVAERVWQELSRALAYEQPMRFFDMLAECSALPILFPDIDRHGEGVSALARSANANASVAIRFAVLTHGLTVQALEQLNKRYRVPRDVAQLALMVVGGLADFKNCLTASPEELLSFILKTDAIRRPARFQAFLDACQLADPSISDAQREQLEKIANAVNSVDTTPLQAKNLRGNAFADALKELRLTAIRAII